MLRKLLLMSLVLALSHTAQGAITLSAINQEVVVGSTNVQVAIFANGPDALNSLQFVLALNDGGPQVPGGTETARIAGVSLDQTIWDVNPAVGAVSTPALLGLDTPNIPNGSTSATFIGQTNATSVVANGALAFFNVDVSRKNVGDTIVVNPNFFPNFGLAFGPNLARIELLTSPGRITIVAVPEPSAAGLLLVGLGTAVMRRRRRFVG